MHLVVGILEGEECKNLARVALHFALSTALNQEWAALMQSPSFIDAIYSLPKAIISFKWD